MIRLLFAVVCTLAPFAAAGSAEPPASVKMRNIESPVARAPDLGPPIVACCSGELSEAFRQLAGPAVRVVVLTALEADCADYALENHQALACRRAVAFVYDDTACNPRIEVWKDRLKHYGVSERHIDVRGRCDSRANCLRQVHQLLVELFPELRSEFDDRLQQSFERLVPDMPQDRVVLATP